MPEEPRRGARRGPDLLAVVLLGILAVAAVAALYGVVHNGYMSAGALAGLIAVGGAFAAVHALGSRRTPPKNTLVHGGARPASERETRRAARGEAQGPRLDDREF